MRKDSVLIAVAVLFCVVAPVSQAASVQGKLSRAASTLAGQPVVVQCSRLGQDFGQEQGNVITIDLAECVALVRKGMAGPENIDAADGAATLAHEIGHVVLGGCESAAEAYAMSHWQQVYRMLGFGRLTEVAIGYVRSIHRLLPPIYRRPC